jgi:hypothetical protein
MAPIVFVRSGITCMDALVQAGDLPQEAVGIAGRADADGPATTAPSKGIRTDRLGGAVSLLRSSAARCVDPHRPKARLFDEHPAAP